MTDSAGSEKKDAGGGGNVLPGRSLCRLAVQVLSDASANVAYRQSSFVDQRLVSALSAYTRAPSAAEMAFFDLLKVDPGNSFDCLTQAKMNSVYALLCRIITPPNTKAWTVSETPDPSVPEFVEAEVIARIMMQHIEMLKAEGRPFDPMEAVRYLQTRQDEIFQVKLTWAQTRAKRMDRKVDDLMLEGGGTDALQDFVHNLTVYGTGVIIGPTERIIRGLRFAGSRGAGAVKYRLEDRKAMFFEVPETCDVYPSPGTKRPDEGNLVVKVIYAPHMLADFAMNAKKHGRIKGWCAESIKRVLLRNPNGGVDVSTVLGDNLTRAIKRVPAPASGGSGTLEGLRWFGSAPGQFLLDAGVERDFDGRDIVSCAYYECDVIYMDGEIIYAQVCDPVIGRPVHKTSFYGDSNVWFGAGLADVLAPIQAISTVCLSGLKKQVQMVSGPQMIFNDMESFVGHERPGFFASTPNRTFLRKNSNAWASAVTANAPAVQFLNMPHAIRETLAVISALDSMADDRTGFPRYLFGGGNFSGAARTAQGLTRIQESANILADFVIANVDSRVTSPLLRSVVKWLNYRGDDDTIRGDVMVVARGALGRALLSAQADSATAAFNAVMTGMVPGILGPKRIMGMLRMYLEKIGFDDVNKIIGTKEEMEFAEAMANIAMMQKALGGQMLPEPGEGWQQPQPESGAEPAAGTVAERRGAA